MRCMAFMLALRFSYEILSDVKNSVIIGDAVVVVYPASYPVRIVGALLICKDMKDKY